MTETTINNRKHQRTPVSVDIKISHPDIADRIVKTKNISDSGLFVLVEPAIMPPIGAVVTGQVQGMAEEAPVLEMKIVRVEESGVGLQFVDE